MGKEQELLDASRKGNISAIERLVCYKSRRSVGPLNALATSFRKNVNVNCYDASGETPLHLAALNGHKDAVELLMQNDASPNITDGRGCIPLHLAAWSGNAEICKSLIVKKSGISQVNTQNSDGDTPLHCAAQYGHTAAMAVLLQHNTDPSIRNLHEESSLDLAAQYGRVEVVQQLIRSHPELIHRIHPFKFPLHLAARNGHKQVVELLLDAGVNINAKVESKTAGTALHEAAFFCKLDVVKLLLERGIDVSETDTKGQTALDLINSNHSQKYKEVVSLITEFFENRNQPVSELDCGVPDEVGRASVYDRLPCRHSMPPGLTETSTELGKATADMYTQPLKVKRRRPPPCPTGSVVADDMPPPVPPRSPTMIKSLRHSMFTDSRWEGTGSSTESIPGQQSLDSSVGRMSPQEMPRKPPRRRHPSPKMKNESTSGNSPLMHHRRTSESGITLNKSDLLELGQSLADQNSVENQVTDSSHDTQSSVTSAAMDSPEYGCDEDKMKLTTEMVGVETENQKQGDDLGETDLSSKEISADKDAIVGELCTIEISADSGKDATVAELDVKEKSSAEDVLLVAANKKDISVLYVSTKEMAVNSGEKASCAVNIEQKTQCLDEGKNGTDINKSKELEDGHKEANAEESIVMETEENVAEVKSEQGIIMEKNTDSSMVPVEQESAKIENLEHSVQMDHEVKDIVESESVRVQKSLEKSHISTKEYIKDDEINAKVIDNDNQEIATGVRKSKGGSETDGEVKITEENGKIIVDFTGVVTDMSKSLKQNDSIKQTNPPEVNVMTASMESVISLGKISKPPSLEFDTKRSSQGSTDFPLSPTGYPQPPTPDFPPPSPTAAVLGIQQKINPLDKRKSRNMETITETSYIGKASGELSEQTSYATKTEQSGQHQLGAAGFPETSQMVETMGPVPEEDKMEAALVDKGSNQDWDCLPVRADMQTHTANLVVMAVSDLEVDILPSGENPAKCMDALDVEAIGPFAGLLRGSVRGGSRRVKSQIYEDVILRKCSSSSNRRSIKSVLPSIKPVMDKDINADKVMEAIEALTTGSASPESWSGEEPVFDDSEEWAKIAAIMASFGAGIARESVFVRDYEADFTRLLSGKEKIQGVGEWLEDMGLGQYENTLVANGYDDMDFLGVNILEDQELEKIGIKEEEHRKKILQAAMSLPQVKPLGPDNMPSSVEEWLHSLRIPDYLDTFISHNYNTMEIVRQLWELELTTVLDISTIGHRKRILASLGERQLPEKTDTNRNSKSFMTSLDDRKPPFSDINLFKDYTNLRSSGSQNESRTPSLMSSSTLYSDSDPDDLRREYLSSAVVRQLNGTDSTREGIAKMKKSAENMAKIPSITLSISYKGVKFIDANSRKVVCEHEIGNIFCACQDSEHLNFFAYITKDKEMDKHYCHVFCVRSTELARDIILTLGQAFEIAYQMALKEKAEEEALEFERKLSLSEEEYAQSSTSHSSQSLV